MNVDPLGGGREFCTFPTGFKQDDMKWGGEGEGVTAFSRVAALG